MSEQDVVYRVAYRLGSSRHWYISSHFERPEHAVAEAKQLGTRDGWETAVVEWPKNQPRPQRALGPKQFAALRQVQP